MRPAPPSMRQCHDETLRRRGLCAEATAVGGSHRGWRSVFQSLRLQASVAALVLGVVLLAGCGGTTTQPDATQPAPSDSSNEVRAESTTAVAIDDLTGGKTVALTTRTLPRPPAGFTRQELRAFAERAIDLTQRGIATDLDGMTPTEAFDYVFANQPQESKDATRAGMVEGVGGHDWEWAWASLFETPPAEAPRVLVARWNVQTLPGTLDDGAEADRLRVTLATAIEHMVPAKGDDGTVTEEPVVIQRSVIVQGFEPLGGADWWPGIGVQAASMFDDNCALANGSLLIPGHDPKAIKTDLAALRKFFTKPGEITAGATSNPDDLDSYVKKNCA